MGKGNNGNDRIEFLKQKERNIRAALAAEIEKLDRSDKRDAERTQFLIGGAFLRYLATLKDDPDIVDGPKEAEGLQRMVKYHLSRMETLAERDKKLLRAKGWL